MTEPINVLDVLKKARTFIRNGVALGYIRMPDSDCPDTAHETLPMIEQAITALAAAPSQSSPVESREAIDVEQLLRDTVPGGSSCDPQQIADEIRAWFAASPAPIEPAQAEPSDVAEIDDLLRACHKYHAGDGNHKGRIEKARASLRPAPVAEPAQQDTKGEPVGWQLRRRVPKKANWGEWQLCRQSDHEAIQKQSMHWGMECESRAIYATPQSGQGTKAACAICKGLGYTDAGDPETGATKYDSTCDQCGGSGQGTKSDALREFVADHDPDTPAACHAEALCEILEAPTDRAVAQEEAIGFISADTLEKLLDPEWRALRNEPAMLWTANNPPSRATIPIYCCALPTGSGVVMSRDSAGNEWIDEPNRPGAGVPERGLKTDGAVAQTIREAFVEGFGSRETYNDTTLNTPEEAWEKSDARDAALAARSREVAVPALSEADARILHDGLRRFAVIEQKNAARALIDRLAAAPSTGSTKP